MSFLPALLLGINAFKGYRDARHERKQQQQDADDDQAADKAVQSVFSAGTAATKGLPWGGSNQFGESGAVNAIIQGSIPSQDQGEYGPFLGTPPKPSYQDAVSMIMRANLSPRARKRALDLLNQYYDDQYQLSGDDTWRHQSY
ncbi:MAG: hypothetical protein ACYDCO_18620 [Armatimonadota bacterium]